MNEGPGARGADADDGRLAMLAADIDELLNASPEGYYKTPRPRRLVRLAETYAAEVWSRASAAGAIEPSAAGRVWAREFSLQPVFIVGALRSGTTLLRNLLDGHPELAVLPAEGNLLTQFRRRLRGLGCIEGSAALGRIWITRFVHSQNLPPYWLLGRRHDSRSGYTEFARRVMGWSRCPLVARFGTPYDAFLATMLAFAAVTRAGSARLRTRSWVEKSPLHELHMRTSLRRFPDARCIHVVRDPRAALVSRRIVEANVGGRPQDAARFAREIGRSLRRASGLQRRYGSARYRVLRYEDLLAAPRDTLAALSSFLRIEYDTSLEQPTVVGQPAVPNSSHGNSTGCGSLQRRSVDAFRAHITSRELALIRRHAGKPAGRFGYDLSD